MTACTAIFSPNSDAADFGTLAVRGHRIEGWDSEHVTAWAGREQPRRAAQLEWSTAVMHVVLSVWSRWSVVVLFMPESIYGLTAGDKLLLGATATLIGGCVRILYGFAGAGHPGRRLDPPKCTLTETTVRR